MTLPTPLSPKRLAEIREWHQQTTLFIENAAKTYSKPFETLACQEYIDRAALLDHIAAMEGQMERIVREVRADQGGLGGRQDACWSDACDEILKRLAAMGEKESGT